jgi:hypothetical protein
MPLFHVSLTLLQTGSVILPGNFGRMLRTYTMNQTGALYFREFILEDVRRSQFVGKPSRFESCFCLETLDKAEFYRTNVAGSNQIIYAVELVTPECNQHRGDFNKVSPLNNQLASGMVQVAQDYWNGVNIENPEIVASGPIRILEKIG